MVNQHTLVLSEYIGTTAGNAVGLTTWSPKLLQQQCVQQGCVKKVALSLTVSASDLDPHHTELEIQMVP